MAFGFGLLRIFIITPFSVWDEHGHYEISYRYSDFLLFKFKSPHLMDKNHADYSNLEIEKFFLREKKHKKIENAVAIKSVENPIIE